MKKNKMFETSDAWSTSRLSHRPSEPAYHIVDWRISSQTFRVPRSPILELYYRAAGISKILVGTSLCGRHNLPPSWLKSGKILWGPVLTSSYVPAAMDILRKSAVCWSTEGRWPLCLFELSISYTLSKPPIFELLHSLLFLFSTWGLYIMSSRCLWKAPDSCAML